MTIKPSIALSDVVEPSIKACGALEVRAAKGSHMQQVII